MNTENTEVTDLFEQCLKTFTTDLTDEEARCMQSCASKYLEATEILGVPTSRSSENTRQAVKMFLKVRKLYSPSLPTKTEDKKDERKGLGF
ncbi:hypothetical protein PROFUN_07936 [Planoprotostelium fungivorum]|uniref:Mitochondrial import inner membrane translocase subunit n=1 Tax=Planoprotostelium fungivorum TaxID=1890364 RepID=A0A2P6NL64_9EUKA|nr:hypothetical protein PROFUN_07936 [Planoprotostelium fungivorum]